MGRQGEREGRVQLGPEDLPPHRLGELDDQRDVADVEVWDHAAIVDDSGAVRRLGMPPFTI